MYWCRNDRKTDAHGGFFILVSEKYLSSEPSELKSEETSEQLWIKLQVAVICVGLVTTCSK
jgi:hypothetical protein